MREVTTGQKMARTRCCRACSEWRFGNWPAVEGTRWPRCKMHGTDAVTNDPITDIDDAFAEGPNTNCPLGKWAGLVPVDIEAAHKDRDAQTEARFVTDPMFTRLSVSDAEDALVEYVANGQMTVDVAERVMLHKAEATDLDVPAKA